MDQKHRIKVKFLNGLTLETPSFTSGYALKEHVASKGLMSIADIMLVQSGREICDSSPLLGADSHKNTQVIHALLRSKCSVKLPPTIQLTIKFGKNKYQIMGEIHSKIFSIKRVIERLIKLNSNSMRLMMNGCIMKDSYLLGDYILHAANKSLGTTEFVIHVTKVFDIKKEVDISIHFTNGCKDRPLTFSYSISEPISHMREVLFTRFMLPKSLSLVLTLRGSNGKLIKLDSSKRLLDYGVGSPGSISNKVNIYMYKTDDDMLEMEDVGSLDDEIKLLMTSLGTRKCGSSWSMNKPVALSPATPSVKVIETDNNSDKENVSANALTPTTTTKNTNTDKPKSGFKRGFLCSNNKNNNTKKGK